APDADGEAVNATQGGATVAWVVNDGGSSKVFVHARDDEPIERQLPTGVLESVRVTTDGRRLVGLFGSATRPRELITVDSATGDVAFLTDSQPPAFTGADAIIGIEPVAITFESHDGQQIPAWLYRPNGGDTHGVVLSVHGGPEAQEL